METCSGMPSTAFLPSLGRAFYFRGCWVLRQPNADGLIYPLAFHYSRPIYLFIFRLAQLLSFLIVLVVCLPWQPLPLRRPNWRCAVAPYRQRSPTAVTRSCRWGGASRRLPFRRCRRESSTGTTCRWAVTDLWLPPRHRWWFPSTVAPCTRATVAFWVAALHSFLARPGAGGNRPTMPLVAFPLDLLPPLHPAESITATVRYRPPHLLLPIVLYIFVFVSGGERAGRISMGISGMSFESMRAVGYGGQVTSR